jgi:hypothetical protein
MKDVVVNGDHHSAPISITTLSRMFVKSARGTVN